MRFRFLGDGDCPDWLLAEINTLSKLTSIKIKILGQVVAKSIANNELEDDKVKKLTQDAKLELDDAKAIVAAVELILTSSARHGVSSTDLSSELQQLGLPREHSAALARVYSDNSLQITEALTSQSLRGNLLTSVQVSKTEDSCPFSEISLTTKNIEGKEENKRVLITKDNAVVLLAELKRARSLMEGL